MSQENKSLNTISRYQFLILLKAAIDCKEYQFAKQATMLWLVNFPGDLFVQYQQAFIYEKLGKSEDAKAIYQSLLELDPLFIEPHKSISNLAQNSDEIVHYQSLYHFLINREPSGTDAEPWISNLWQVRTALTSGDFDQALGLIHQSIISAPSLPLPAVFHLKTVNKIGDQEMLNNLSEIYIERWPKCLQINIIHALSELEQGKEAAAVDRLHWVAAHDSAGQVIQRLMGANHRFSSLWPEQMEIYFDLPIPATITAELGRNQLQNGIVAEPEFKTANVDKSMASSIDPNSATQQIHVLGQEPVVAKTLNFDPTADQTEIEPLDKTSEPVQNGSQAFATQEDFEEIQKVFSKLAKKFKQPELERADNRFPVYVVMTSKKQLEAVYGPNTAAIIDEELKNLINNIQLMPDWSGLLFYPDDPSQAAQLGITPKIGSDAWQVKLALSDLDSALAKRGEMIAALLIVGGPEIVPFHHLPNPTFDTDLDVPSDNPYATIDKNYFIPQWPVGRLPGEAGSDAGLLLSQIRQLVYRYGKNTKTAKFGGLNFGAIFNSIWQFFSNLGRNLESNKNLGYSAEVWREASENVFKTIGNANDLRLSPPDNASSIGLINDSLDLGYFNLHGVEDGPNWYGQKDFSSTVAGPDYPIALNPDKFSVDNPSPGFVLSEACYGANVNKKQLAEALSLKFLDSGTRSFIGSTCIAYGSVTTPLIAADFLAEAFWRNVLNEQPAGYALMQAKLSLAEEMTKQQGFLDGEDQKTLLSFILFGDPLAKYDGLKGLPKPLVRVKSHPAVRALSDSDLEPGFSEDQLPNHVSKQVRKVVEKYIPGLKDSQMVVNKSQSLGNNKTEKAALPENYMVTLKKTISDNEIMTHNHYARMTFDKKGKLLKFTTSR